MAGAALPNDKAIPMNAMGLLGLAYLHRRRAGRRERRGAGRRKGDTKTGAQRRRADRFVMIGDVERAGIYTR